jgi:hypothetical protein
MPKLYRVEIVEYDTEKVVKVLAKGKSEWYCEKVDRGLDQRLNEDHYSRIVEDC